MRLSAQPTEAYAHFDFVGPNESAVEHSGVIDPKLTMQKSQSKEKNVLNIEKNKRDF